MKKSHLAIWLKERGLYEHDMSRIIRYAIAHHRVFWEPRKGFVAHSAASKVGSERANATRLRVDF